MCIRVRMGIILLLTGFIMISLGAVSEAGHHFGAMDDETRKVMKEKKKARMQEMYKKIGISSDQEQKLSVHREKVSKEREAFWMLMVSKKKQLSEELQKQELDMTKIDTIHGEMKSLLIKKADDRLSSVLYVRQVLTPEQFSKFMKLKDEHKKKWREKWKSKEKKSIAQ